ncbi:MAG: imidazolonepropionase [Bacteroidia bacterium]|nr:imidazolonepropionase [Bacteroidia bacterium]MCF8425845.1 imidazolonepropionase [Bacteroidia bacterium]
MGNLLLTNIKSLAGILESGQTKLAGKEMSNLASIQNAWLKIVDGKIEDYGTMDSLAFGSNQTIETIDCSGRFVLPCYVDSHTHIVFAKTREEEFVMRIKGKSYEEIAEAGGGILNSAARLHQMSEDDLFEAAKTRLNEVINYGTGAIEIKSGYGLSVEDELKMLRVIKRLKVIAPIPIKSTFLGAHAFPKEYKQNRPGYIQLIIEKMLPIIAQENLADYMDVFCDQGFFTTEETDVLLEAAAKFGLKPKIHGNELGFTGGVQTAVKNNAISVDHLEYTGDAEIESLLNSETMPVALPGCSFFLGIPYAPFRKMIDAGLAVCLASDYNPGSTPNGRMGFVVALACSQMKLTPEEAINACTINGAFSLELSNEVGSITKGKLGNIIITKPMESLAIIPYHFGVDQVEKTILNGEVFLGI